MQIVLLQHPVVYNKWSYSRPFITESVLYFCEKLFFFQMEVTGIGRFFLRNILQANNNSSSSYFAMLCGC